MNRFDKPVQYDYSFDRYMPQFTLPNFQLLAGALENQEKQQQEFETLGTKAPKYIEEGEVSEYDQQGNLVTKKYGDTEAYKQVMAETDQLMKDMESAHLTGDMATINRVRNDAMRKLKNLWGPMGAATILEERYKGFTEGLKKLKEYEEKATDGGKWSASNKAYATLQFYKNVGVYKPDDSGYKGVVEPSVFPYVDIKEEIIDYMKKAGYTDIEVERLPYSEGWQFKSKVKEISNDALKGLEEYLRSENFSKQYEIERHGVFQKTDFSDIQENLNEHNQKVQAASNQFDETLKLGEDLETNKNDANKVKRLQENLKSFGVYNGNVDGVYGPQTAEALKKFKVHDKEEYGIRELTPQEFVQKDLYSKYRKIAYGVIDYAKSDTLSGPYLMWWKDQYDKQNIQLQKEIAKEINAPTAALGQNTPANFGTISDQAFQSQVTAETAKNKLTVATQTYFWNRIGNDEKPIPITNENALDFYNTTIDIFGKNPNITAEQLKNELYNQGKFNVRDPEMLLRELQGGNYQKAYREYENAKTQGENYNAQLERATEVTLENIKNHQETLIENKPDDFGRTYNKGSAWDEGTRERQRTFIATGRGFVVNVDGTPTNVFTEDAKRILQTPVAKLSPHDQKIKNGLLNIERNLPEDQKETRYRRAAHFNPPKGGETDNFLNTTNEDLTIDQISSALLKVKPELAPLIQAGKVVIKNKLGKPTPFGEKSGITISYTQEGTEQEEIVYLEDVLPPDQRQRLAQAMVLDNFDEQANIKSGAEGSPLHISGLFAFVEKTGRNYLTNEGAERLMQKEKNGSPGRQIFKWQYVQDNKEHTFDVWGIKDAAGNLSFLLRKDAGSGNMVPIKNDKQESSFTDIESALSTWGVMMTKPEYFQVVKKAYKQGSPIKYKYN